ncbi:YlbF family regulator [Verrucomicrobiaceae bacterium N1E253]|uniref:YlbF family regulator n=2 Tax=Oceaniferula marina TaxID=2748318 RepID=A0A851GLQ4_9BACT|nr:YlbF family regulator [Oceaniferula marina]
MSMLAKDSAVMAKTQELCEAISQDIEFLALQGQVERFLSDDAAKLQYQSVHERGEELHQKQHAGVELSEIEIKGFEEARDALMNNDVARDFMEAQQNLQTLQQTIGKYVGMTLELGRVPEAEDMEQSGDGGGCCGGGCGCH